MSTYSDASLIYYPSGYKAGTAYSLKPTDGSGDLTFTRASSATRVNAEGLVETASVLGSELVVNGDFATDTDWTKGTGWTIGSGVASCDGTQTGNTNLYQPFAWVNNQDYIIKLDITVTAGDLVIWGGQASAIKTITTSGSHIIHYNSNLSGNITTLYIQGNVNFIGTIDNVSVKEVITNNVPRIDYTGGGCGKLLLEPQRTNLALYSEDYSNAVWAKPGSATVTTNTTTSPDGTQNADTLQVVAGQVYGGLYQYVSGSINVYTVSIFAKQNTKRWIYIFDAKAIATGWFDLQNGVLGTIPNGYTGSIEDFGNGWYRCIFKNNSAVTPAFFQIGLSDTNAQHTPATTGTAYIYGAQLELGSYVSSYVPTLASSVTRLADAASKTGISSLIGQTEGTLFVEFTPTSDINTDVIQLLADIGTDNVVVIGCGAGNIYGVVYTDPNYRFNTAIAQTIPNNTFKVALCYKNNDFTFFINGVKVASGANSYSPSSPLTRIKFNEAFFFGNQVIDYKSVLVFPAKLSDADAIALTA